MAVTAERQMPQDIAAEQSVLGACLLSKAAFLEARRIISDDEWHRPAHSMIWQAILATVARTGGADPVTVAAELTARGETGKVGGLAYLHTLVAEVPTTSNVAYHAEIMVEKAVARQLVEVGTRITEMGYGAGTGEMAGAVDDAVQRAKDEVSTLARSGLDETNGVVDVIDLMDEHLPVHWLVPGLLTRGERLLLTAAEGLGKSTLLRQILVCAAAGLNPFNQRRINPIRAMGFDFENSRLLSQDRYGSLIRQAERTGAPVERGQLSLKIEPRGVNLLHGGEAAKLLRSVERYKPDLVMIGPIYRLHEGDPNDERDARKISVVMDQIREISGAAIITEGHMAKGSNGTTRSLKPVGSGLWLRWPEYGYGLVQTEDSDPAQRQCDFIAWRGPRDERAWPSLLMSGMAAGKPWPWVEVGRPTGPLVPFYQEAA